MYERTTFNWSGSRLKAGYTALIGGLRRFLLKHWWKRDFDEHICVVPCGLTSSHTCVWQALNAPSGVKVNSSMKDTLLQNVHLTDEQLLQNADDILQKPAGVFYMMGIIPSSQFLVMLPMIRVQTFISQYKSIRGFWNMYLPSRRLCFFLRSYHIQNGFFNN